MARWSREAGSRMGDDPRKQGKGSPTPTFTLSSGTTLLVYFGPGVRGLDHGFLVLITGFLTFAVFTKIYINFRKS